jgi:hypothetical protein
MGIFGNTAHLRTLRYSRGKARAQTLKHTSENMSLSDTFYVALCVTVLILGAVYWFWTQNQYLMRKINLLENIVYEMRAMNAVPPDMILSNPVAASPTPQSVPAAVAPGLEDDDLLHESLSAAIAPQESLPAAPVVADHDAELDASPILAPVSSPYEDDLQPGGIGSGIVETSSQTSALEGMTLKELRRLAEQKGLAGAKTMKKNELVTALRNAPSEPIKPLDLGDATLELN